MEFRSPVSLGLDPDEDAAFAEDSPGVGRDEEGGLVRGETLGQVNLDLRDSGDGARDGEGSGREGRAVGCDIDPRGEGLWRSWGDGAGGKRGGDGTQTVDEESDHRAAGGGIGAIVDGAVGIESGGGHAEDGRSTAFGVAGEAAGDRGGREIDGGLPLDDSERVGFRKVKGRLRIDHLHSAVSA